MNDEIYIHITDNNGRNPTVLKFTGDTNNDNQVIRPVADEYDYDPRITKVEVHSNTMDENTKKGLIDFIMSDIGCLTEDDQDYYIPKLIERINSVNATALDACWAYAQDENDDFDIAVEMADDITRDVDSDIIEDAIEVFGKRYGAKVLLDGDYDYLEGITDSSSLGYYFVREYGFPDKLYPYFDYEAFGSDLRMGMEDDDPDNELDDYDLGYQTVEENGFPEDLDPYFDYDMFGDEIYADLTGGFGNYGYIYIK